MCSNTANLLQTSNCSLEWRNNNFRTVTKRHFEYTTGWNCLENATLSQFRFNYTSTDKVDIKMQVAPFFVFHLKLGLLSSRSLVLPMNRRNALGLWLRVLTKEKSSFAATRQGGKARAAIPRRIKPWPDVLPACREHAISGLPQSIDPSSHRSLKPLNRPVSANFHYEMTSRDTVLLPRYLVLPISIEFQGIKSKPDNLNCYRLRREYPNHV
jgi:hypothetical protein